MLLHAKHARDHGGSRVVIHTAETNVFILMLRFLGEISEFYMKTGNSNKKRVINIDPVKQQIEQELAGDIDINRFCDALLGLHVLIGCDSVSAFAGKGKAKCYNLLRKNLDLSKP